ncbi:MAG: hypothetical protein IPK00_15805 [Deltaproteobacteria bacterium]|nr:hypothetical protein [Deltaproteobacteria bacterium]
MATRTVSSAEHEPAPTRSTQPAQPAPPATAGPIARTALLDATRAQRLAREARLRERDSREALARAREVLEGPPASVPASSTRRAPSAVPTSSSQWQRHPLAPIPPTQPAVAPTIAPHEPAAPLLVRSTPPAAERALAAELREARATLAIARETTQIQRDELARLRGALAQATSAPMPAPAAEPTERLEQLARLSERVQQLEIDLDHRERERAQLIEALATSEREQAERDRRLAALQDRYDVQEQALDQARRQSELERRRHTEAQATLDRLRAALRGIEGEPPSSSGDLARDPSAEPAPTPRYATPESLSSALSPAAPATSPAAVVVVQTSPASEPARPRTGGLFRTPIFERWRESQIRRHFGPLGLETTGDLLRDPLARRQRPGGKPLPILLVGAGVAAKARSLREDLMRSGSPRFALHVADPLSPGAVELPAMEGLDESPQSHCAPESAGELERLVRELEPAVIVVRDFLTAQREVESWLEVLRGASDAGACIILLEETGRGAVAPGDEIEAIGQRIWELLPERYTRDPVTETPVASYREAFARRVAPPRNGLLGALRSRFELELCAQFGFLAEAFVSGPIAGCFDADAARDRRFLEQITDLDDRRVEAGSTAALHLIARVDPLAPR